MVPRRARARTAQRAERGRRAGVHGRVRRCIALFQAQSTAPGPPAESVGLRHVALVVDDLDRAQEHLRSHGVDFRFEDHGNAHSLYFRDPDGHTIELTSYVS